MTATSGFSLNHTPALDGIRGLAILAVFISHVHESYLPGGGHVGVDVFFVLSGFLITSLILKEWGSTGCLSLNQFYQRRAFRLGPALITLLVAAYLFETLYGQYPGAQDSTWRTVYALTYVTNWIWAFHPLENFGGLGALAPLWSLAIEEQFYLVWPPILALFLMRRVKPVYVGGFLLAFIAGSMARRYFLWEFASPERAYFGTDSHADPILVGCLLSVAVHRIKDRFWVMIQPWLGAIVPFALLTVIVGMIAISHQHAPILTAICTALLITAVTIAPVKLSVRIFEMSWLRWFGRISYSLYLWHSVSNMYLLKYELVDSTIVRALIGLLLAVASYYLIEKPALKFKSRRISAKLKPAPLLPLLHSQKRIFADN